MVKQLYTSMDSAELGLLASRLESAGIACEVRSQSQVIPGIPFGPELWVLKEEDYEQAAQLLRDWQNPPQPEASSLPNEEAAPGPEWGDARSIDSILAALYRTISGPAGEERDWESFRRLFHPSAQLMRTFLEPAGRVGMSVMDVQGFIDFASPYFNSHPFYERELFRKLEQFGHIAQVFSTFDSSSDPGGKNSLGSGINGIQLWWDGERWWVMNMLWADERPDNTIPPMFLPP